MPKRSNEPPGGGAKAKVRVFFAEVEGNDDSVQEALKTMVSAMSRPVRLVAEQKNGARSPAMIENVEPLEVEDEIEHAEDIELADGDDSAQGARKARGTGNKKDRNAGLELVPDLDFRPTGQATFKDFFAQKSPANDVETVIVSLYYLQHMMKVGKIGPSHIMTAFKEVSKSIPVDLKQTIRNIKKSRVWLNFTELDDLRMTTQGDNFVEHEMGKSE